MTKTSLTPYVNVARVVRAHGKHGEVVVAPLDGLPFCLTQQMTVWLTPPEARGPRMRTVTSVRGDGRQMIVGFSDIASIADAEGIVGKLVLVKRSDVPEVSREAQVIGAQGREVIDQNGIALGSIVEVMQLPANDVWRIVGERYGEILLPVIDDCVGDIPAQGPIVVRLLPGLVDEGR